MLSRAPCGSEFQCLGPQAEKARSPYSFLVLDTVSKEGSALDRKVLECWRLATKSFRYIGAVELRLLYVRHMTLQKTRCLMGSQCKSWRTGVICALDGVRVTRQAALFCTTCRRFINLAGIPASKELAKSSLDNISALATAAAVASSKYRLTRPRDITGEHLPIETVCSTFPVL